MATPQIVTPQTGVDDSGGFTDGTIWNAAYQLGFEAAINAALKHPECSVYNSATQSIASDAAHHALTFDSEEFDVDGLHSTSVNTSRITIPTGFDGKWWFNIAAMWAVNATGQRLARFYKNGAAFGPPSYAVGNGTYNVTNNFGALISVVATDYIEAFVFQDSGGPLAIGAAGSPNVASCRLQAFKVF